MSKYFKELLRNWQHDKKGSVAMMTGLSIPVVIGIGGIAMETSVWNAEKQRAQTAADFSAHAAAVQLSKAGPNQPLADAVAISQAAEYGYTYAQLETTVTDDTAGLRVDVTINQPVRRYFSQLFDDSDLEVQTTSAAIVESAGEACLVALDPNGDGVQLGGNTDMTMNNCLVASNSKKTNGFEVSGSSTLTSACAGVVGGSNVNESAVSFSDCRKLREGIAPVVDPYAGVPIPSTISGPFANCVNTGGNGNGNGKGKNSSGPLTSGRYCGGFTFSGTQQIEDGAIIVVDGGDIRNQGPAMLQGTNVTIILKNDARVFLTSQSDMDLTAKSTGDYAGLIFIGDAATQSADHRFAGGSASQLTGAVYLPTDNVELRGGANMATGCLHFIAGEIDARGNSDMSNNCDKVGTKPLVVLGGIRMVKS